MDSGSGLWRRRGSRCWYLYYQRFADAGEVGVAGMKRWYWSVAGMGMLSGSVDMSLPQAVESCIYIIKSLELACEKFHVTNIES